MDYSILVSNAIVTSLVGAALYTLYQGSLWFYQGMVYHLTTTLEITTDTSLQWTWLQFFIREQLPKKMHHWSTTGLNTEMEATLVPTPMQFRFEGVSVRLQVFNHPQQPTINSNQGHIGHNKTRLMALLWARHVDAAFFKRFLAKIKEDYIKHNQKFVSYAMPRYFQQSADADWIINRNIVRRSFETLTLDKNLLHEANVAVDWFLSKEGRKFHKKHSIPYHLGLLLEGSHGNGKSSFILALASRLGSTVRRLDLQTSFMDDGVLAGLMVGATRDDPPCIIVLEDVDCLTTNRKDTSALLMDVATPQMSDGMKGGTKVTFSGLLNSLDGLGAPENAIIIMTTNHPERLDPALIRPGRVDCRLRFETPDDARISEHYLKFFPEETLHSVATQAFVKKCRDTGGPTCSMAFVQGRIVDERRLFPPDAVMKKRGLFTDL